MNRRITLLKLAMSAISSVSSASTSSSASAIGGQQAALQQAKRIADQAETTARTLATQAANAQANASDAEAYARSLNIQAGQAQLNVGYTQQHLSALQTAGKINSQISSVANNVVNALPAKAVQSAQTPSPTAPTVVNTQGQVTGKIINTRA